METRDFIIPCFFVTENILDFDFLPTIFYNRNIENSEKENGKQK